MPLSGQTSIYGIPKEANNTGIADARTFNAAMDYIDGLLADGIGTWKPPVDVFGDLPGVDPTGTARVVKGENRIYIWSGSAWVPSNYGATEYQGTWNANTNTPTLASSVGIKGYYYVVSVSGSTNLDGISDWVVGDWVIFNGAVWEKADHTDVVSSVFGRLGAVTAQVGDYAASQVTNDSAATGTNVDDVLNTIPPLISAGSTGRLTFDGLTKTGGRGLTVGAGTGLVKEGPPTEAPPAVIIPVSWASTPLTVPADSTRYIEVDKTGTVALNPVFPDVEKKIHLGTVVANGTDIIFLSYVDVDLIQKVPDGFSYLWNTVVALVISGCIATINTAPLKIDVDSGEYYIAMDRKSKPADVPIDFRYWLRDGSGGWVTVNSLTDVDPDFYDSDAGSPTALPVGKWKKDLLYFAPDSNTTVEYHIVYGQEVFDSKIDAVNGNIPNPPPHFYKSAIRCAGIVIQQGTTVIDELLDYLPRIGQALPPQAPVTDHGMLSGLSDNDHPQYILKTSERRIAWGFAPTSNGVLRLVGWYIQTDVAAALASGSPVVVGDPGYHSHFAINVSAGVGLPFTVRFTGRSINESTGVETPGDTEDVAVSTDGWYQTVKSWLDAPTVSIVEAAKSCTIDIYRTSYWDRGNSDFTVTGLRVEWTPSGANWDMNVYLRKVNNDGNLTTVDSFIFSSADAIPRAAAGEPGKYKRLNYTTLITGSLEEGIVIEIDQQNIDNFEVQLVFNE